jgi:hypothetical protein
MMPLLHIAATGEGTGIMDDLEQIAAAARQSGRRTYATAQAYPPQYPATPRPQRPLGNERIWTVHDQGRQFGPHTEQELASLLGAGTVSPAALVWREGSPRWIPLTNIVPLPPWTGQAAVPPVVQVIHHVQTFPPRTPRWSPGIAAVLSFLIPGLGQMYKGQIAGGLCWMLFVFLGYLCFILPGVALHLCCIFTAAMGDPYR